jgi:hypothetical protein
LFVGILCMVGVFLISYKGYDRLDHYTSNVSGILAVLVALFPTRVEGVRIPVGIFQLSDTTSGKVHDVCAALLFVSLAFISAFLFTKTKSVATMTERKKLRNHVYRICGAIMFGALLVALVFSLPGMSRVAPHYLVIAVETVCLWAFGVSWLVKGDTILRDEGSPVFLFESHPHL